MSDERSCSTTTICAGRWSASHTRSSRRTMTSGSRSSASTPGARCSRSACTRWSASSSGAEVPLGDLDISFYRDDVERREPLGAPVVHASHLDFELEGRTVILVDDVLYTGRTVRAAIDALFDYGRPARVQLAVLADRGHRELPIRPDYVGKNLPTAPGERVNVRLEETDGRDEVAIAPAGEAPRSATERRSDEAPAWSRGTLRREEVERILDRAESFAEVGKRDIKKVPTLRGRTIVNLFYESSTRTSSSFELAAKRLSADVVSHQGGRLRGRQGRVAEGHDRDPLGLRPGGDRDPRPARRRRRPGRPLDRRLGRSTPATASTSTRARRCSTSSPCASGSARSTGLKIWIVGDVLHSRVARSCLLAFQLMGAEVTLCGPPTLIPRGIESLGCEVAYDLDGLGDGRRRLRAADAARADERELRALAARVRRPLPDRLAAARAAPAPDAPRPGQPRRRARPRGDRLAPVADHRPGRERPGGAHGDPLRAAHRHRPRSAASAGPRPADPPRIGQPA